jgi:glutamate N-acetyltransferase/amino-acid N-acetyltransferase
MQAERAGRLIANSMLVKTAINGGDPNWGRIVQALGAGSVPISTKRLTIAIGGVTVFKLGVPAGSRLVSKAAGKMKNAEVSLQVDLGRGRSSARIYSCDLSREYVSINADYTT